MQRTWQDLLVRAWFNGGVAAYSRNDLFPGNWIARVEEALVPDGWRGDATLHCQTPIEMNLDSAGRFLHLGRPNPPSVRAVLFPRSGKEVGIRGLLKWAWRGARRVWFHEPDGWKEYDLPGYLLWRVTQFTASRLPGLKHLANAAFLPANHPVFRWAQRIRKSAGPPLVLHPFSCEPAESAWSDWMARPIETAEPGPVARVVHYIGALHPGGAERQLCNLAIEQSRRGIDVRVLTTCELKKEHGHYAGLLAEGKVSVRPTGGPYLNSAMDSEVPWHLLRMVPEAIQYPVVHLIHELLVNKPDVLHCWLDQPNVIGAIAGLMAGVPRIILSTRNSNPTNFPRLLEDYLERCYQLAARSNRVHFIANSHSGAASYAEWIGLPVERFHVVFNGLCFDHFPKPTAELRRQARGSFGLATEDRVVCGIFRLAAEKQPELFLDVVRRVHARVGRLQVLLVGVGDLESRVRDIVRQSGMDRFVRLLGRRSDVGTIFLASDASLLTSTLEGCPNVALESQYLGVPIVATAGGGTVDAVEHGVTGFLAGVSDAASLADSLTQVLLDESLRRRLSAAGPPFVQRRFALEHMVDRTMAVYEGTCKPISCHQRILSWEPEPTPRVA
jgi:glycosyltransferase involved in cell wall biosynthesis